ncbi:MAG: ATP-dependent RNA helicase HrpA [Candidatus Pelagadaptatus aseana]|uniref:ATP-dependent RNA helicase HrpA n=1 Tax=Candidatus Pelagadaptatus aseana TaxID=3120508 RepID=UPI0039B154C0
MNETLKELQQQVSQTMGRDRFRLSRKLKDLKSLIEQGKPSDKALSSLQDQVLKSMTLRQQRLANRPVVTLAEGLPISERADEIKSVLEQHQVVILAGETGSGKTTQLPKICLEIGRGVDGLIGHTQPRRIAARTVASRIAEELNSPLGEAVGYQVRFTDHSSDNTHIKLMTDGILLAEIQNDRYLNKYDTLIIDEAHERSLNIDFLLGYLKSILPKRPDLKVIVTSATIDLERFSKHFTDASGNAAPIVEVSGRTYPVTTHYRPMADQEEDQPEAIVATVDEILKQESASGKRGGDILVFLSGERDIRETALALRRAQFPHLEVLPLYARLSLAEQNKVFASHRGRRIVLATNVAETSITVPGIRYVIDPGYARVSRYSYRSKIQRLPIEAISQASANQRKGRCGRVSEGICYRLYDEDDFIQRPEFTDAEILRTNLAAVILQMLNLRIGDIRDFPFVDNPDQRLINDGFKLLQELQAVDRKGKLTRLGRQLMTLPLDPKLGRMLLESAKLGSLKEVLLIVSAMAIQDPRERPADKQQAADEKHRRFRDEHSDFIAYINLWNYVEEQRQELSKSQFRKLCKREFLSFLRLQEWREIHHQLLLACKKLSLKPNSNEANYDSIHRALLPGLLGQIGSKAEDKEYLGARNRRFHIFPGSSQAKKSPKWIAAGQLLETSRVFAHQVARVDPVWVVKAAEHLLKRNQYEPHFDVKSGQVMAYECVSLYGLILVEKQRVGFSQIDPKLSREIFIRAALVEGQYRGKGQFFKHNQQLIEEIHELEAKTRRRDILVDDEILFRFYEERVAKDVVNLAGFERWRKDSEQQNPNLLGMEKGYLMQHDASAVSEAQFPTELTHEGLSFPLAYHFEPNHPEDGVSMQVPVAALHLVPEKRLEWIIPGILRDKCIALVKALPKQWRKHFVPVPAYVDKALAVLKADNTPLCEALAHQLKRHTGVDVPQECWNIDGVDDYYRFNIQVMDANGKVLSQGRDLKALRDQYRDKIQNTLQSKDDDFERTEITQWDFETFPETIKLQRAGMAITAYPVLLDSNTSVTLSLKDNPVEANYLSRRGVTRLGVLSLNQTVKYLRKQLLKGKDLGLTVVSLGRREQVVDDLIMAAVAQACFSERPLPRSHAEFETCLQQGADAVVTVAQDYEKILVDALTQIVAIKKAIKTNKNALAIATAAGDINQQLSQLVYPGFLFQVPRQWLQQYNRYLKAMQMRLEKVASQIQKDKIWTSEVNELWDKWYNLSEKMGEAEVWSKPELIEYRWMLEEYRVSLFAQTLKTVKPVSAKRLQKLWSEAAG